MVVKTLFTRNDFINFLSHYDVGTYAHAEAISQGTVQTNYVLKTTQGKFMFRYYENRARASVLFERDLLVYLTSYAYPCPTPIKDTQGHYVGTYRDKPYILFTFIQGRPVEQPSAYHWQQLIQKAAELQRVTQGFHSPYTSHRWNYTPDLCRKLAQGEVTKLNTHNAREKFAWLAHTLTTLDLPPALPKGICHCDFHFSNVLFEENEAGEASKLVALLDFDDANYTYLQFDLVGLMEYWAWPHTANSLDMVRARRVVQTYMKHRPLPLIEQRHLYDVYKLSILFDCVWYFGRGGADDFYEKRKIAALTTMGRQTFFELLFGMV